MGIVSDKLVLVTGAGSGIGAATAREFAIQGCKVIAIDINLDALKDVIEKIKTEITHEGIWPEVLDVTNRQEVIVFAEKVRNKYGTIDILVNNAGIAPKAKFDSEDQIKVWDSVMAVNLQGMFNMSYAFVEDLKKSKGNIINTSSVAAFAAGTSSAGYTVSKGGVRSLTQALSKELGQYGVRVNAIAPGSIITNLGGKMNDPNYDNSKYTSRAPLGRIGTPEEVAKPIVFLASDMASYITGVVLPIDGGFISVY